MNHAIGDKLEIIEVNVDSTLEMLCHFLRKINHVTEIITQTTFDNSKQLTENLNAVEIELMMEFNNL